MNEFFLENLKHINELNVYRGESFVGILKRTDVGCELSFDSLFLQDETYKAFTYQIKKQNKPLVFRGVNLPPFFAGLIPEGLRLKALVQYLKTSEDDLFSLLAASGESTVGDIYVKAKSVTRKDPEIPKLNEIDFYKFFEEKINSGFLEKGNEGLAGVQEKISASMISFPVHAAKKKKSYILKLNPKDKPNLTQNEFQCLKLAQKCGIEVNGAKIVYDKNKNPGILIERFDRVFIDEKSQDKSEALKNFDQEGKIIKVHQEDACQFLGRYPADKYRLSFSEICEGIKELTTAPIIEVLKVIQLYAFSYLIGNGDLHGKNISLQTDVKTGRTQLTPAYDLICTYIYRDHNMALKLDSRDKNFKRKYFIEFGERFGIQKKAIETMLNRLIIQVKKNQHLLFEIPNLTEKERHQLRAMLELRIKDLGEL